MKNLVLTVLALVIIAGAWLLIIKPASTPPTVNTNTGVNNNGSTPVVNPNAVTSGSIVIDTPIPNATTSSPIAVTGKARGNWFFEASAPVMVVDSVGKTLGQGNIQAVGEWMTTEYVPFTGLITYTLPAGTSTQGYLLFMNDNPSGDPSRSVSVRVPIQFKR